MKRIIDNENVNIIGSQIKAAREKSGMTQKQLSENWSLKRYIPAAAQFRELRTVSVRLQILR